MKYLLNFSLYVILVHKLKYTTYSFIKILTSVYLYQYNLNKKPSQMRLTGDTRHLWVTPQTMSILFCCSTCPEFPKCKRCITSIYETPLTRDWVLFTKNVDEYTVDLIRRRQGEEGGKRKQLKQIAPRDQESRPHVTGRG